jgi:hypothetical protein
MFEVAGISRAITGAAMTSSAARRGKWILGMAISALSSAGKLEYQKQFVQFNMFKVVILLPSRD